MKSAAVFAAFGLLGTVGAVTAHAQEVGRVISSTPVIQQVAVPRQVCSQQPVAVQQPSSGGGAVVGAIVGGLLGNTIGHGTGRLAATGVGMVAGAAVGDNVEGRGQYQTQLATQCTTQTWYENRTTAYNVTYEYAGKQFNVQMPYDPGATIPLQIQPMAANPSAPANPGAPMDSGAQRPVSQAPQAIILAEQPSGVYPPPAYYPAYPAYPSYPAAYPVYPGYQPRPIFAPIGISLGLGYVHHGGRRHWRH